jgi:hypothetical protein
MSKQQTPLRAMRRGFNDAMQVVTVRHWYGDAALDEAYLLGRCLGVKHRVARAAQSRWSWMRDAPARVLMGKGA